MTNQEHAVAQLAEIEEFRARVASRGGDTTGYLFASFTFKVGGQTRRAACYQNPYMTEFTTCNDLVLLSKGAGNKFWPERGTFYLGLKGYEQRSNYVRLNRGGYTPVRFVDEVSSAAALSQHFTA